MANYNMDNLNKLVEMQKEFAKAYCSTGMIDISSDHVQLTAEAFHNYFGIVAVERKYLEGINSYQSSVIYNGVKFLCLEGKK